MKVALVHDWLTGMRGGERVLERLCRHFPEAPLYTLVWKRGAVTPLIESRPIHVSFLQRMPGASRLYRWYLPLFPRAIESFDFSGYDVVVSSSHAVAKGARTPRTTFHLSYVHTPMRYVWELEPVYFPPGKFPWPLSSFVARTTARLRRWDAATGARPDHLVANSAHVAARIARHWGRDAEVIPPPVDVARFRANTRTGGETRAASNPIGRPFYLLAGAFAPYKRADLAIEACAKLGRRLIVVGGGQDARALRARAHPGVEFIGWASDAHLAELYRQAQALIFPGEEDFGIVPVEAIASGCPVIALGHGGAVETVGRGATSGALARVAAGGAARVPGGVLFGDQTVDGVADALLAFESEPWDREALPALAQPFAEERFDQAFAAAFDRAYGAWRARPSSGAAPAS
jgi:glycosyltransferase involved in cell wall biosynthesis